MGRDDQLPAGAPGGRLIPTRVRDRDGVPRWGAVAALFLGNGLAVGSWLARIAATGERLGLDDAALGTALLGLSLGTVLSTPVVGGVMTRRGPHAVAWGGLALATVALPLPGLVPNRWALAAVLAALGIGVTAVDIAMNALGTAIDEARGRSRIVGLHGLWSVGGLVAAGITTLTIRAGVATAPHLATVSAVVAVVSAAALWACPRLARDPGASPRFAVPRGALWPLAALGAVAALGEGAAADWSGVLIARDVGGGPAAAPLGYLGLSVAMAAARLSGDRVVTRLGMRRVVRGGGIVAVLGFVVAVTATTTVQAVVGFALVGIGVASGFPLAFAAAARSGEAPRGEAIAAIATAGYTAFLAGPPVIGFLAQATSLRVALGLVGVLVGSLIVLGRGLPGRDMPAARGAAAGP